MVDNRISILTTSALTRFATVTHANRHRLRQLWLVSPWIGGNSVGSDPISFLVEALQDTECSVNVVTRKPALDWHMSAVRVMWENFHPTLYYCPSLHTKLYLAECDGFRFAIFGSPNLTPKGDSSNRELAIEFRTTVDNRSDTVSAIITRLSEYARDLAAEDDVKIQSQP